MPYIARLISLILVAIFFFLCIKGIAKADTLKFTWKPEPDQLQYLPQKNILVPLRRIGMIWGSVRPLEETGERCMEHRVTKRSVCYDAKLQSATIQELGYEGPGCKDTPLVALFCPNLELVVVAEEKKDKPEDKANK